MKQRSKLYVITFDDGTTLEMHAASRRDCRYCLREPSAAVSIEPKCEPDSEDFDLTNSEWHAILA